jgi:hypothetical protein
MVQTRLLLAVTTLATLALMAPPSGAFFYDIWGTSADGNMDCNTSEGYAINADGGIRFSNSYQHFPFMAFNQVSDGADRIPPGKAGDTTDGALLADWMVGKKAFSTVLYLRNMTSQTCDPFAAAGTYMNSPVTILGFRVANAGSFVDRGSAGHGWTGCCASYNAAKLEGGENAPPAWRMGTPTVLSGQVPSAGRNIFSQKGDIGIGGEYYKVSSVDSTHPGQEVKVGQTWFSSDGSGYQGFSGSANRFAFGWLIANSNALMVNGATLGEADCTGFAGEEEPRDVGGDGTYAEGWFAKKIDRCIVQAMAGDPETKGLVFSSITLPNGPNVSYYTRDQGGITYGPYLVVTATVIGDVDNDGCCDVLDLLWFVDAFGSAKGDANFNEECDYNCDGYVDVVDLLNFVDGFGYCVP